MTTVASTVPPPFDLDPGLLAATVNRYAGNPIYADRDSGSGAVNPYRRQLAPQSLSTVDFGVPIRRDEVFGPAHLAGQRLLTCIYEADLVFLPERDRTDLWEDFRAFYSPTNRALGEMIRPSLERQCFGFLDDEVEVTGVWDAAALQTYLTGIVAGDGAGAAEEAIAASADPARAARNWMIQFAPDFLSEASPMIRNVLGNYGPAQSEWFKIVIDEYGYGVHETKHSTLFVDLMRSLGLDPSVHRYWQLYLAGSLALNNYFHYLGKNHEHFFRYLGALYYTECTLVGFCDRVARMLDETFDGADATYFTEHVHIDVHHGRMALEKLVLPLVERCGDVVIPEIVRGVEEFRELSVVADDDMAEQIRWMDGLTHYAGEHDRLWPTVRDGQVGAATPQVATAGIEVTSDQADVDILLHVGSGALRLFAGHEAEIALTAGGGVVVPAGRLAGVVVDSAACTYETWELPEGGDVLAVTLRVDGRDNCVVVGGRPYVYARTAAGSFVLPARCPHRGGPLHLAEVAGHGQFLRCPWHERRTSLTRHRTAGIPAVRRGNEVTVVLPVAADTPVEHQHVPIAPGLRHGISTGQNAGLLGPQAGPFRREGRRVDSGTVRDAAVAQGS